MSTQGNIIVLKFGSSVLQRDNDLPHAVHEIYRHWRAGSQVLVVVSAVGDTTDELLGRAQSICQEPDENALAILLATGEATASALLALAIQKAGLPVRVLNATQAGLRTSGSSLDAELQAIDVARLQSELRHGIVVLPGFVGRDENDNSTLLGRGGSDFTAVFVAHELGARCILLKDVTGLYPSDPARVTSNPPQFAEVTCKTASRVAGTLVQPKAISYVESRSTRVTVMSTGASSGTEIGSTVDRIARTSPSVKPLEVALLGCGTVGGGVYQRILELPEMFTLTGVAVRDAARPRQPPVSRGLLTEEAKTLIEEACDVVVELIGGIELPNQLVTRALRLGRHIVTANKALLAEQEEHLQGIARENNVSLRSSASVGGAMPAREAIERAKTNGPIRSISGVLNGTTNFILDELVRGTNFQEAIASAQRLGLAEANPTLDLNGTDSAQKLVILAREAFGVSLPLRTVEREGLEGVNLKWLRAAYERGHLVRLVASCERSRDGLVAKVAPVELPPKHELALAKSADNRLLVELESGETFCVSGAGAGRWPTTEAVIADLMELRRELTQRDRMAILEGKRVA